MKRAMKKIGKEAIDKKAEDTQKKEVFVCVCVLKHC